MVHTMDSIVLEEEFLIVLDLQRCSWYTAKHYSPIYWKKVCWMYCTYCTYTAKHSIYWKKVCWTYTICFIVVGAPGQYAWCSFPWVGSILCVDTLYHGRCSGGIIQAQWCFVWVRRILWWICTLYIVYCNMYIVYCILYNRRCSGGTIQAQWCFPRVGSRLSQVGDRAAAHMLLLLLPS